MLSACRVAFFVLLLHILDAAATASELDQSAQGGTPYEIRKRFLSDTLSQPKFSMMRKKMETVARAAAKTKPGRTNIAVMRKAQALDAAAANDTKDGLAVTISQLNKPIVDLLYEGDILLTNEQAVYAIDDDAVSAKSNRTKRQAVTGRGYPQNKWSTQAPISFFFDAGVEEPVRQKIRMSLQYWQDNTCVYFQENGNTGPKVRFFRGEGCYSQADRDTGSSQQGISIGQGCSEFHIITHEIAHTLGLIHEMSRYDRDDWVDILWNKISRGWQGQYSKSTADRTTNLNVPYDYGSAMHYGAYQGSNVQVLAKRKQYQHTMGNTYGPVFNDLLILNRYYQCSEKCPYGANCQNSGFRHPRNCNMCICPNGYGGADCSQRQSGENGAPSSCGQTVQATYQYQTLSGSVTAGAKGPGDRFDAWRKAACHFHIQAPAGQRVEVRVQSVGGRCNPECFLGWTEVKFADLTSVGARLCCPSHISDAGPMVTTGNLAIVSVYSGRDTHSFSLQYRISDGSVPSPISAPFASGGCVDRAASGGVSDCPNKAAYCSISIYQQLMREQCPKTCGFC